MARIVYGIAGEGRGHATRARAIVERLRPEHDFTLLTSGQAFELLAPLYHGSEVRVQRIPGLRFRYDRRHRLDPVGTAAGALRYLVGLPVLVERLARRLRRDRPDLVLCDFEPATPRAAARCGLPCLAVDHQGFLEVSDFGGLPRGLAVRARLLAGITRLMWGKPTARIVSSFYFPPIRAGAGPVLQVGVFLRPELKAMQAEDRGHLCVYLRRRGSGRVLEALHGLGMPARIYGLGALPARGPLEFMPIDEQGFLNDLAGARALVSTAGNQLLGEALWFGKPIFAMPEARNHEQALNGWFLEDGGGGVSVPIERVGTADLRAFLGRLGDFRYRVPRERLDGLPATLEAIRGRLSGLPLGELAGLPAGVA